MIVCPTSKGKQR